jgi:Tol biopolymer transport system component/DNA-binding winged helix-turn-helix (wHTH) protein
MVSRVVLAPNAVLNFRPLRRGREMSLPGQPPPQVRFGDFELDLQTGEVCSKGHKFTLQGQPFQVLTILLGRPGQLVTREELKSELWPSDTFVDFDHSLNKAVKRLRDALMDSAENPHFIETLPRRGYRWIGPACREMLAAEHVALGVQRSSAAHDASSLADKSVSHHRFFETGYGVRHTWIFAVLAVAVVGLIVLWLKRPLPPPRVVNMIQITQDRVPKLDLLTDGPRIYINETLGLKQILVQAALIGGETSVIPTPFSSITIYDISPDHTRILAADTVGIPPGVTNVDLPFWAVPLAGGIPRRLGDATGHFATWSPDGHQLAFAKGFDIYAAQADGSNILKLSSVSGLANWLRFSPDGTRLRFTLTRTTDNTSSLWEMRADGGNLHSLLPGWHAAPGEEACGMWSPDGRYYFFVSSISGVPSLWALRENAGLFHKRRSVPVQLTTRPMFFGPFVPSLDGKRLLADGWLLRGELVRYDNNSRQFVGFFSDLSITDVDFSRDGQWVAYVTWPEHTLWRSRVDGNQRLQLTSLPIFPVQPRWSPDGKQIAYVNVQSGHPYQLFLISADGGTPRELLSEPRQQMDASWSPDGTQIVFGRVPWLSGPAEKLAIQVVHLTSKQVSPIPGSENLFAPRWSPDGQHLAALSADSKKLMLYDFRSKKWTNWIDESDAISSSSWSRAGNYIYYDSSSQRGLGYRRAKIGKVRSELVVDLNDLRRLGTWSGLAPDGSPLFIRDMSADDIYALELELP